MVGGFGQKILPFIQICHTLTPFQQSARFSLSLWGVGKKQANLPLPKRGRSQWGDNPPERTEGALYLGSSRAQQLRARCGLRGPWSHRLPLGSARAIGPTHAKWDIVGDGGALGRGVSGTIVRIRSDNIWFILVLYLYLLFICLLLLLFCIYRHYFVKLYFFYLAI